MKWERCFRTFRSHCTIVDNFGYGWSGIEILGKHHDANLSELSKSVPSSDPYLFQDRGSPVGRTLFVWLGQSFILKTDSFSLLACEGVMENGEKHI